MCKYNYFGKLFSDITKVCIRIPYNSAIALLHVTTIEPKEMSISLYHMATENSDGHKHIGLYLNAL